MNTPAHAVLNLTLLGARTNPGERTLLSWAILLGALLPDLPMIYFFIQEAWIKGQPQYVLWNDLYFRAEWQNFFDCFNSIPITLIMLGIALWRKSLFWRYVAFSMLLHIALDLPLHHDDGHRHFFPFSDWRFESPVSYWDPRHHGNLVGLLEMLLVVGGCALLFLRQHNAWLKTLYVSLGAIYGGSVVYWLAFY